MSPLKWILPIVCVAGTLSAQSLGDLNGLINTASHYVHQGMSGTPHPQTLELCKVVGDNGGKEDELMTRSVDVVHWKFQYRIDVGSASKDSKTAAPAPKPPHSVLVECDRGVFGGFKYSETVVNDVQSLENTWIGISLEDAIDALKAAGYNRGFSRVILARPANTAVPDEYVYAFDCPWERTQVGVSTQTGELVWRANL